ncbi:MAG: hypothetical protein ACPW61_07950 [Methyloligella sp. ZOD6]
MLKQTLLGAAALGLAVFAPLAMGATAAHAGSVSIEIGNRWDRGHHNYRHHYDRHHDRHGRYHGRYHQDWRHAYRHNHYRHYDRHYDYWGHRNYRRWW